MFRPCSRKPRRWLAHALALAILSVSGSASADFLVSDTSDSRTSMIQTAGGFYGTGIGDLGISGTFDFNFFDPVQSASILEAIDVSTSPASGFAFPEYVGFDVLDNIGTLGQRGTESNPLGLQDKTYFATFDKFSHELDITGVYYQPVPNGLIYEYTVNTIVVPEPSRTSLLASSLLALAAARRRHPPVLHANLVQRPVKRFR